MLPGFGYGTHVDHVDPLITIGILWPSRNFVFTNRKDLSGWEEILSVRRGRVEKVYRSKNLLKPRSICTSLDLMLNSYPVSNSRILL